MARVKAPNSLRPTLGSTRTARRNWKSCFERKPAALVEPGSFPRGSVSRGVSRLLSGRANCSIRAASYVVWPTAALSMCRSLPMAWKTTSHERASCRPHSRQKLASPRFSCWHRGHRMPEASQRVEAGTGRTGGASLVWGPEGVKDGSLPLLQSLVGCHALVVTGWRERLRPGF
jgi:hypothetical protein